MTGPTGSGKSTTLAALLDWINRTRASHIVTIEDPVEFLHVPQKSLISHRELGFDTPTFAGALKAALREDPDVVLVGELRDLETMSMALQAAETGLLVFGTLHTNSAAKAVDRLIDSFPADEQEQMRTVLAEVLKAVVAQVLLKKKGGGRVPAFEVLRGSSALSNSIREGKTAMITTLIQTGRNAGMIGMDQYLADLVVAATVDAGRGVREGARQGQLQGARREAAGGRAGARRGSRSGRLIRRRAGAAGTERTNRAPPRAAERPDRDRAAVERGDLRDEGEAEAGPGLLRREERDEELRQRPPAGTPAPSSSTATRATPPASPSPRSTTRPPGPSAAASHGVPDEVHERAAAERGVARRGRERPVDLDDDAGRDRAAARRRSRATSAPRSHGASSSRSGRAKKRKSPVTRATCSASALDRREVPRARRRIVRLRGEARPAEDRPRRVPELVRDARRHLAERRELAPGRQLALEARRRGRASPPDGEDVGPLLLAPRSSSSSAVRAFQLLDRPLERRDRRSVSSRP